MRNQACSMAAAIGATGKLKTKPITVPEHRVKPLRLRSHTEASVRACVERALPVGAGLSGQTGTDSVPRCVQQQGHPLRPTQFSSVKEYFILWRYSCTGSHDFMQLKV